MNISQAVVDAPLDYMLEENTPELRVYIAHCILNKKLPGRLYQPMDAASMTGYLYTIINKFVLMSTAMKHAVCASTC